MTEMSDRDREELARFQEMFAPEDLDPELVPWLDTSPTLGRVLKHPLIFSVPHSDHLNRMVNQGLRTKREALDRALAEEDWPTVIWLHERPHRPHALREIADRLDDADYWELLSAVWHDSENIFQWGDHVREFFFGVDPDDDAAGEWSGVLGDRDGRAEGLMDDVDRRAFALLDDEILVYRGYCRDGTPHGWSWTTDHLIALFFARRYAFDLDEQHLVVGRVRKADVIAYTQARGESEVIVDPEKVYGIEEVPLSATCECGAPVDAVARMSHEQHMKHHATVSEGSDR